DGTFTYTPDANFNGSDGFTYEISDGAGGTAQASVTITVDPVNDAPTLSVGDSIGIYENVDSVFITATDTEGDPIRFAIVGGSDAGLFAIDDVTGELHFNAAPNFERPMDLDADNVYEVTLRTSDAADASSDQTLSITVYDVNEAPTIDPSSSSFTAVPGVGNYAGTVLGNDPEGDDLAYTLTGGAALPYFTVDPDSGVLAFANALTPSLMSTGEVTLEVTVTDEAGLSQSISVTVKLETVAEQPEPEPEAEADDDKELELSLATESEMPADEVLEPDPEAAPPENMPETVDLPTAGRGDRNETVFNDLTPLSALKLSIAIAPNNVHHEGAGEEEVDDEDELLQLEMALSSVSLNAAEQFSQDVMKQSFEEEAYPIMATTAAVMSATLTAGFASWALRAGSLATAMLSTMPAWRNFDPLPILSQRERKPNLTPEARQRARQGSRKEK
ncbi:MAG: tandem-95 repeat protein, partial [Gemmatimonadales bacterium]